MANLSTSSTYDNALFYRSVWIPFLCILLYESWVKVYKLQILQFKEPNIAATICMCVPHNVSQPRTKMLCSNTKQVAG
jgi:hypothetical protein